MSQHPSLRSSDKDKKHRSVLKRYERVKILRDKEKWKEEDSVFGLQKVKVVRFKIKKEKAAAPAAGEAEAVAPGAGPAPAAAPAKGAPTKGAPAKAATKAPGAGEKKESK